METKAQLREDTNFPLCLSSREEGWSLEAMARQDGRITHEDFMQRMPFSASRPDIQSISMRRSRFRWKAGCKSWVSRSASGSNSQYLDKRIRSKTLHRECRSQRKGKTASEDPDILSSLRFPHHSYLGTIKWTAHSVYVSAPEGQLRSSFWRPGP